MARQWRIEYGGAIYHGMSRDNERRNIVTDDRDRTSFIELGSIFCFLANSKFKYRNPKQILISNDRN